MLIFEVINSKINSTLDFSLNTFLLLVKNQFIIVFKVIFMIFKWNISETMTIKVVITSKTNKSRNFVLFSINS